MGMAIDEKIEMPALLDVLHQSLVVTMGPGDLDPVQFEVAERFVQRFTDAMDCLTQTGPLGVAIAEDEVGRETLEEPDRLGILDVAAMDDVIDLAGLQ